MTMSAISHYRGGTIDVVAPVAKLAQIVAIGSSLCNTTKLLMRHCRQPSPRMPSANRRSPRLQSSRPELAES